MNLFRTVRKLNQHDTNWQPLFGLPVARILHGTRIDGVQAYERRSPTTTPCASLLESGNQRQAAQDGVHRATQGASALTVDDSHVKNTEPLTFSQVILEQWFHLARQKSM
jgi:hypothetical protein